MALQLNYGIRNYRLLSVSHCDARFRRCLPALNGTISNIIGVTSFNLLEVSYFVLEESEECVQRHWRGGTLLEESEHWKECNKGLGAQDPVPAWPTLKMTLSELRPQSRAELPLCLLSGSQAAGPRVCRCYEYLDKYKHQIVPHEVKYELHNVDTQALFHCNCTHRVKDLNDVEVAVLANQIAIHCFVLKPLTNCSPGKEPQHNCITATRAVLVHVKHLRKTMRHWGPPHVTSRDKHPDWNTQDSDGTLYEQCLQLALEQKPSAWPRAVP